MLKHFIIVIATILVVSSTLKAQLEDLVFGEWGPGLVTVIGDCYTDPEYGDLTFVPGTTVQFNDNYQILIVGGTALYANGTEAAPILFTSPPGNPAAGDWHALIADGSAGDEYAVMTLTNCEIRYGGETFSWTNGFADGPIRLKGYAQVTVDNCYIHNCLGAGVDMDHDDPGSDPNRVRVIDSKIDSCEVGIVLDYPDEGDQVFETQLIRNYVTNIIGDTTNEDDEHGIIINLHGQNTDVEITNNIVHNTGDDGVWITQRGGYFFNNVIDGAGDENDEYGINISYYANTVIYNNIVVNTADYAIYNSSQIQLSVDYNCYSDYGLEDPTVEDPYGGNINGGTNDIDEDPKLVEAYGEDNYYHLLWNSLCLGTGDNSLTNNNPATSISDMGAYGGPELDPDCDAILMSLAKP